MLKPSLDWYRLFLIPLRCLEWGFNKILIPIWYVHFFCTFVYETIGGFIPSKNLHTNYPFRTVLIGITTWVFKKVPHLKIPTKWKVFDRYYNFDARRVCSLNTIIVLDYWYHVDSSGLQRPNNRTTYKAKFGPTPENLPSTQIIEENNQERMKVIHWW